MITIDHRLKLVSPGSLEISQYCSPGDMVTVALGTEYFCPRPAIVLECEYARVRELSLVLRLRP